MMHFTCEVCGEQHVLETLIEFPQPHIIGKITGGELGVGLNHIGKNFMAVNREYIIAEVELKIKLTDYEDELDMMVWAKIDGKEFREKVANTSKNKTDVIRFNGTLMHIIPYYEETKDCPIVIETGVYVVNDKPTSIIEINKDISLKKDFENGITLKALQEMLQKYYHDKDLSKHNVVE